MGKQIIKYKLLPVVQIVVIIMYIEISQMKTVIDAIALRMYEKVRHLIKKTFHLIRVIVTGV